MAIASRVYWYASTRATASWALSSVRGRTGGGPLSAEDRLRQREAKGHGILVGTLHVALKVAHVHGVLRAWEATPRLGGHVGWVSVVACEVEEVVVRGLPLAHEMLVHARDGVGGKGEGHDPCGVDGAWEDGQAGLVGEVVGSEDGGHGGGHGWCGDGGCCGVCCHCWERVVM